MDAITNKNFIKALQYFPKWMQIRRRPYKSNAGYLLMSIIEEMTDIWREVDEYAKDFFLVNYAGREDTIISKIYKCAIGELNPKLKLDNEFTITQSLAEFYKHKKYAYYENGYLYFKIDEIENKPIGYSVNKFHYTANIEIEPVWNIFDEFAWFAGIDRLPDESNLSLSNRTYDALRTKNNKNNNILFDDKSILDVYKHRFNSTEFGIKYLIKNLLSAYAGIAFKDIHIDKLNEINIQDVVNDQKVYDYISELNKDIAREKVWDLTFWENQFKKMDYSSHTWDQPVEYYQQGVGYYDSLKVITSNEINSSDFTDVNIIGYKKSKQKISQYLLNSNKSFNIDIGLKKYGLDLKPLDVQYSLKATSAVGINPESIVFNTYNTYDGLYTLPVEKFVDENAPLTGITVSNKGHLVNNTNEDITYKVVAQPNKEGGNIYIDSFKIGDEDIVNNYYNNNYFKKENNSISYVDNYFYGTQIRDFASTTNVYDTKKGVALDITKSTIGTFTIPLTADMEFKTINYNIIDKPINIINRFDLIKLNNFKYNSDDNTLYIDSNARGSISIEQIITSLEFEIDKLDSEQNTGSCQIVITDDNNNILVQEELNTSTTNKKFSYIANESSKKKITIYKIGQVGFKIKFIKASANGIIFSINGNRIPKTLNSYSLPDNINNKLLTVTLYSYLGISSPVLEYISIAGEFSNFKFFEKEIVVPANTTKDIKIESREAKLLLYKNNNLIDDNFDTYNTYSGIGKLPLSLNSSNLSLVNNELKTGTINGRNTSYIDIDSDIKYIDINFNKYEELVESLKLFQILINNYEYDHTKENVFVTYNGKIIIYNNSGRTEPFKEVTIERSAFSKNYNLIKAVIPDSVLINFIHDNNNVVTTKENSDVNKIIKISLATKNSSTHVLNKSDKIVQNQKDYNIDLESFVPKLSQDQVYYLEINLPDNYDKTTQYIRYTYDTHESLEKSCLIGNNINIVTPVITVFANYWNNNESNYNVSLRKKFETTLFSSEFNLNETVDIDGTSYNLSEYSLTVPSYLSITYTNKTYTEDVQLTEDGLGKLKYSNVLSTDAVVKIGDHTLTNKEYAIYSEPGIILIDDIFEYNSLTANITYTYKVPIKISFNSLDKLYELVEYNIDAYDIENLLTVKDMKDGESRIVTIANKDIDKLYATSTNSNFTSVIINNKVTVYRNNTDNRIAVKSGYYYENGKEYYFGVNESTIHHHRDHHVDFNNTKKQGSLLVLNSKKQNFIPNSLMDMKILNPLCYVNFKEQKEISEISSLHSLTTANTFNNWTFDKCDPTLLEENKNYIINFNFDKNGYAIFRIDKYIYDNTFINIKMSGNLIIRLFSERKLNGFRLQKKPLLKFEKDFTMADGSAAINFTRKNDLYYYIVVTGTQGSIEEIVISDKEIEAPHKKNIDKLGWDITEKKLNPDLFIHYDNFNASTTNLDIDDDGRIVYGTTMDYDATLIGTSDLMRCQLDKVLYRNNKLITLDEPGVVITEIFDLIGKHYEASSDEYYKYMNNILYFIGKINTLSSDVFKITVLGSDSYYGTFSTIGVIEDSCFTLINNEKLTQYIRLRIDMPANTEISSIDVYNIFNETDDVKIPSLIETSGVLISRLLMVSDKNSYNIDSIDGDIKGDVRISVRTLRKNGIDSNFTQWKELYKNGKIIPVAVNNTDTFQFRIELLAPDASVLINKIGLTTI